MSKFKVGDRVKVVGNNFGPHHNLTIGTEAEILTLTGVDDVWVAGQGSYGAINQYINTRDIELVSHPAKQKIVVTTDGKTTTAQMFSDKKLVKSAEAKCSPGDEFVFETGAAIALDRLLGREKKAEPEAPRFTKADLKTGLFGRMNDGRWFVVLDGRLLYGATVDEGFQGGYDNIERLSADLSFNSGARIDLVVEAVSFFNGRDKVRRGEVLWSRPGVTFK